jgi:flagellar M-ring protein FliF
MADDPTTSPPPPPAGPRADAGLGRAVAQLRELVTKLDGRARALVGGAVVLAAIAFGALVLQGAAPKRVLFSGLDPRDAAQIVAALDAAKIDYELAGGGSVIEVEASRVDEARLLVAEKNLPKGGSVGFELFENQSLGMTDFAQQVTYRRALQGELERTIAALEPVAAARVHLTLPERAVFEDEKLPATASVTLALYPGRTVEDRHVGAIRHLVAAAVEGLEPEQVTVVDADGTLLSRSGMDAAGAAALDYRRDLERDLERRLTRLLERTVGVGGAQVTVSAEVDFSRTDTTEETFDPEQTAVRSESIQNVYEGPGAQRPEGLAGAPANEPGAAAAGQGGGQSSASKQVSSKTYEVNRTVVHTTSPTASLKRLTVAVLIDGTWTTPEEEGAQPVFSPRTSEELEELKAVVENAVGFNAARGDRIKVSSVPFEDRPRVDDALLAATQSAPWWLPYAVGGGALALLAIVALVLRRRGARARTEVLNGPTSVAEAQRALGSAAGRVALAGGMDPAGALAEATVTRRDRVIQLAGDDPERTADILRGWMREAS